MTAVARKCPGARPGIDMVILAMRRLCERAIAPVVTVESETVLVTWGCLYPSAHVVGSVKTRFYVMVSKL